MHKSFVVFTFLPLLGACAGSTTPQVKTAQDCRTVAQDDTGSNIKIKRLCSSTAQGGGAESKQESGAKPAPQ